VRRGLRRSKSSGRRSLCGTGHRGSSVISLIFACSGSGRICCGNERPWTSRLLKHSLVACGRSGTKLVRTLRYNQERNEALAELVALHTQQSAAAVRSALAPIFSLPAE
jgi:hypothetical protein